MKAEHEIAKEFILHAVKNKYSASDRVIEKVVEAIFFDRSYDEIEGLEEGLVADLERQTRTFKVLRGLDQKSSDFAVGSSPVTRIHALASGVDPLHSLRSTRFVEDFGGDVPTRVDEVGVRLDELERLVVTLSRTKPLCDRVKATLLAHVFSSIIRIHPFQDGNGRVARFTVLYLITCWEVDPFLIPKVRNSRAWKSALASAVEGDTQDLTHVFLAELVSHNNKVEGNE